jgi:hypothetical protein
MFDVKIRKKNYPLFAFNLAKQSSHFVQKYYLFVWPLVIFIFLASSLLNKGDGHPSVLWKCPKNRIHLEDEHKFA